MVRPRALASHNLQLDAAGTDPLAVGDLANEVRQLALRPRPGHDRQLEAERERLRPAAWSGSAWVRAIATGGPPASDGR